MARKLASLLASLGLASPFTSMYSSVLNELLFQPQLWLMANWSGELENLVKEDPVADAHEMVKCAEIVGRGSRYGWVGIRGEDVVMLLVAVKEEAEGGKCKAEGEEGARAGEPGTATAEIELATW